MGERNQYIMSFLTLTGPSQVELAELGQFPTPNNSQKKHHSDRGQSIPTQTWYLLTKDLHARQHLVRTTPHWHWHHYYYYITIKMTPFSNAIVGMWLPPQKTIDWRRQPSDRKRRKALKHLFDKVVQDYFGQPDGEPNVTINMRNLVDEESDDKSNSGSNSSKDKNRSCSFIGMER